MSGTSADRRLSPDDTPTAGKDLTPCVLPTELVTQDALEIGVAERIAVLQEHSGLGAGAREQELVRHLAEDAARDEDLELSAEAAARLAKASDDTPRDALNLLWAARDEVRLHDRRRIEDTDARKALVRAGRSETGLSELSERYLRVLDSAGGCLGIKGIAAKLGLSKSEVEATERFLIRRDWVEITWAGRRLRRPLPNKASA